MKEKFIVAAVLLFYAGVCTCLAAEEVQEELAPAKAIDQFIQNKLAENQAEETKKAQAAIPQIAEARTAQAVGDSATSQPVLHLTNGDFAAGLPQDSADPAIIRWQCAPFTQPFEFSVTSVSAVHFPLPAQPAKATGEYGFELAGGDLLFGSLLSLSEKEVVIDSTHFGKLHLRREFVRRLMRWGDAAGFVYVGPNGLTGWKEPTATIAYQSGSGPRDALAIPQVNKKPAVAPQQPAPQPQWWQETGHAVTDKPGASIFADVGLPAKAIIEVEISWRTKPDFMLSLADVDRSVPAAKKAADVRVFGFGLVAPQAVPAPGEAQLAEDPAGTSFRIEVLGANIILMRDLGTAADLVLLDNLSPGAGRIHWQVYLDQEKGSAAVYSTDGKQLGELELGDKAAKTKICTGVRLINKRGDIRLERLRVSRWNGDLPQKIEADKSRLHKADGTIAYGEAKAYDAQRKQFIVAPLQANSVPKAPESRVDAAQVTTIVLSRGESSPESTMSVSLQDGVRISGKLMKIANGQATLASGAIIEPISVPIAQLQSLLFMNKSQPPDRPVTWQSGDGTVRKTTKPDANAAAQPGAGRVGRLEVEGLRLHGELASGESTDQSTCLVWQPIGCNSGSPLRHGTTGQVIYRDPPPKPAAAPTVNTGGRVVRARVAQPAGQSFVVEPIKSAGVNPSLHLRVGDNIPCEVTKIDEKGVTFRSPVTDATFVANEKVKAVELAPEQQLKNLGKTKRERLLTLPRMQKTNPPTHLVIAKNGDYLRGRLSELNEKMLALEVRLESRQLPRDKISRIVWFHPEATEAEAKAPPLPLGEGLVQTLRRDGHRLTFQPDRCDAGVLSGKSEVLGKCRVDVSLVDQILFGKAIDDAAPQLAYHPWKLQDAPEPKFVQEDANDATSPATGTESALVGKPAPDFELPLLAGGKFKLSRQKGSIVVLDFFATWCGPCVQAMPQIDKVVEEFKDQKVKLVAVNMQEDQKQIKDLLERLDINPTVALDRDGAVAERYGVSAIPQTVVIDAEGNVARLFIGGGPKFAEQLAEAIRAVLKPAEIAN